MNRLTIDGAATDLTDIYTIEIYEYDYDLRKEDIERWLIKEFGESKGKRLLKPIVLKTRDIGIDCMDWKKFKRKVKEYLKYLKGRMK